jgi:hypothetical protein
MHKVIFQRFEDPNVLPYLHVTLVFIHFLTFLPGEEVSFVFQELPWNFLSITLNFFTKRIQDFSYVEAEVFPTSGRPLPEDYIMRGLPWADRYHPRQYFEENKADDDERYMEWGSMALTRMKRVLYLGCRIAAGGRWLRYNNHRFSSADEEKHVVTT